MASITDQLVDAVTKKPNKKKGKPNMKKVVIITAVATVATILLFVAVFMSGVSYQKRTEANINARIEAAVNEVK